MFAKLLDKFVDVINYALDRFFPLPQPKEEITAIPIGLPPCDPKEAAKELRNTAKCLTSLADKLDPLVVPFNLPKLPNSWNRIMKTDGTSGGKVKRHTTLKLNKLPSQDNREFKQTNELEENMPQEVINELLQKYNNNISPEDLKFIVSKLK